MTIHVTFTEDEPASNPHVDVLIKRLPCDSVHGVTGQVYETGTLPVGTFIRNIKQNVLLGCSHFRTGEYEFLASSDGGETWYTNRSMEKPQTG